METHTQKFEELREHLKLHSEEKKPRTSHFQIPFEAANYQNDGKRHLLLGATGSVASIKLPLILHALSTHGNLSVRVILTHAATHFLSGVAAEQPRWQSLTEIPNVDGIYLDEDEWGGSVDTDKSGGGSVGPWTRGAPILHINLRRWSHLFVIAPLSADALAKLAHGFSDGLLFSVFRAWDTDGFVDGPAPFPSLRAIDRDTEAPGIGHPDDLESSTGEDQQSKAEVTLRPKQVMVFLSMNTAMWRHPATAMSLKILEDWGSTGWIEVLRPIEKQLACGDSGIGAMMAWQDVVGIIETKLDLLRKEEKERR